MFGPGRLWFVEKDRASTSALQHVYRPPTVPAVSWVNNGLAGGPVGGYRHNASPRKGRRYTYRVLLGRNAPLSSAGINSWPEWLLRFRQFALATRRRIVIDPAATRYVMRLPVERLPVAAPARSASPAPSQAWSRRHSRSCRSPAAARCRPRGCLPAPPVRTRPSS